MTKNKLTDLNDHLFIQLERLNDEELKGEELEQEIDKSKAITDVAQTIINNASLLLNAQKHYDDFARSKKTPELLRIEESKNEIHKNA